MSFLPEDYEMPTESGDYVKFVNGVNRFRIMSDAIYGYEWWTADKKPHRTLHKPTADETKGAATRHFWAMIVWNYETSKIQVMQIHQKMIQKPLDSYFRNPKWGEVCNYDICIIKEGNPSNPMLTKYQVSAEPHSPITEEMKLAFLARPCQLEALFSNGQPFGSENKTHTPMASALEIKANVISREEAFEMMSEFLECSPEFRANVKKFCASNGIREDFTNCKLEIAAKMRQSIRKNAIESKAALHPMELGA